MPLFKITGYPDEENIRSGNHNQIETWITEARNSEEAEKIGFQHFFYFHEINVSEYKKPKIQLKIGDIIEVENRPGNVVRGTVTYVGNDNNTRYTWVRNSTLFGKITAEEILLDWQIEQGRVKSVNGKIITP